MLRHYPLTLSLLAVLVSQAAHAQAVDPESLLIQQGLYWQKEDKPERAIETWKKVLKLNPQQVDALYGMGFLELKAGNLANAKKYLARLQQLSPRPREARQLDQDIYLLSKQNQDLLAEAIRLDGSGDKAGAAEVYKKLLAGRQPEGIIARDFYTNLAYTDAGWPQAKAGFQRLLREFPGDSRIALLYAKQLIRREDSRSEGMQRLGALSKRPEIAGEAFEAWRNSLIWSGPPDAKWIPRFEEFMAEHPDDDEVRQLLETGKARVAAGGSDWKQDPNVQRGLAALDRGDIVTAEREFKIRLKSAPNDSDALGGMGVIRLQQDRLQESVDFLTRATGQKKGGGWKPTLNEARYWYLLEQSRLSVKEGNLQQGRAFLEQATQLKPNEPTGLVELAGVQLKSGQIDPAEAIYRRLLKEKPDNKAAKQGLISLLSQQGKTEEALALFEQLPELEQARLGGLGRLRADDLVRKAKLAEQRGDTVAMREALEEALRNAPSDTWTRFALARLYVKLGATNEARSLVEGQLAIKPNDPEALYTSALMSVQLGDLKRARASLASIPGPSRTIAMDKLASDIDFDLRLEQIRQLIDDRKLQDAKTLLTRSEPLAEGRPERLSALAIAHADAGDLPRGLSMLRNLIARTPGDNPQLTLQYAGLLLRNNQDAAVGELLRDLGRRPLSEDERSQLEDVTFYYRIRQADRLTQQKDYAGAYDALAPALASRPNDNLAQASLARIYAAAGEPDKALELYRPLLRSNPDDAQLHLSAAEVATQARETRFASKTLDVAVAKAGNDPKLLAQAAQIYRRLGESGEAADVLKQVVALEQQGATTALAPPPAPSLAEVAAGTASNPFRQRLQTSASSLARNKSDAQKALDEILEARSTQVTGGLQMRSNNGEDGLGRMVDIQAPLEADMPLGKGRLAVHVTPVSLTSGRASGEAANRFGGGPIATEANPGVSTGSGTATGVGLDLSYKDPNSGFKADIGVSPQGFLYSTLVGGAGMARPVAPDSNLRWSFDVSRRAVTDSVLSFAGTEDKRTGQKWGGVTANGAKAGLSYDDNEIGVYGNVSGHSLVGNNVVSNTRLELGAGIYWYLQNTPDEQLTAGMSLTAISYGKNLSQYTYGHGGYFSPQKFFALGFPVSWSQRFDKLRYSLRGSVGIQYFDQDSIEYFPGDADLQAAASKTLGHEAVYQGSSKTSLGYSLAAAGEYQLGSRFFLGGQLGVDNSQDYRQWSSGLYLRYNTQDVTSKQSIPVTPHRSPYANQ